MKSRKKSFIRVFSRAITNTGNEIGYIEMNPLPLKPFIRNIFSQEYFFPGIFFPQEYFFPDPHPKYSEDINILNTAPKFGDL